MIFNAADASITFEFLRYHNATPGMPSSDPLRSTGPAASTAPTVDPLQERRRAKAMKVSIKHDLRDIFSCYSLVCSYLMQN